MMMIALMISQVNTDGRTGENITGTKEYKYFKSIAWRCIFEKVFQHCLFVLHETFS